MPTTPNQFHTVEACAEENRELLNQNTLESIQEFMLILGPRLWATDPGWGYLTKTPAEKHITLPDGQFVSVDAFIYGPTDQVVDTLSNAADPAFGPAEPAWAEVEKREDNNWYPIKDYNGGGGTTPDNGDCNCQAEIADLQKQINELFDKVVTLESKPVGTIDGRKIALRSNASGKYLRVKMESPTKEVQAISDISQNYEEFFIKDMD